MKFDRIYVEITNICNLNCPFCSNCDSVKREMSIGELEFVLGEVNKYTDEVCLHVLGEPLLHSKFNKVMQSVKDSGLKINLVTNGFYLKDKQNVIMEYSELFKKINVSLHAYKYLDNPSGKIEEILDVCSNLSGKNILTELRNLYSDKTSVDNNGNSDDDFDRILINSFRSKYNFELNGQINQKIKGFLYYVMKKPFVWPDKSQGSFNNDKTNGIYCLGGRTHIAVLSDLNVVPCCLDSSANLKLGNLQNEGLSEIVNSARFKNIYNSFGRGVANEKFCQACFYNKK